MLNKASLVALTFLWLLTPDGFGREVIYNDISGGITLLGDSCPGSPLIVDRPVFGDVGGGDADASLTLRLRKNSGKPDDGYSICLLTAEGERASLTVTPIHIGDPLRDEEQTKLTFIVSGEKVGERILPFKKFDNRYGYNIVRIERMGNDLSVACGRTETERAIWLPGAAAAGFKGEITSVGIVPSAAVGVEVERLQFVACPSIKSRLRTGITKGKIKEMRRENLDSPEGHWNLLDFDTDDRYLRPGGDYRVAVVPWSRLAAEAESGFRKRHHYPDNSYAVIYVGGAAVNERNWETGMLKGVLLPAGLSSAWRLLWFDSQGELLDAGNQPSMATATMDASGKFLTLAFPARYSTFRFIRTASRRPDAGL